MALEQELRTSALGLRITPTLKAALEQAARDDHRSVAGLVEMVLTQWLNQKGYLEDK
jgi:hypothetical protein